jgi:hypothetical protein
MGGVCVIVVAEQRVTTRRGPKQSSREVTYHVSGLLLEMARGLAILGHGGDGHDKMLPEH